MKVQMQKGFQGQDWREKKIQKKMAPFLNDNGLMALYLAEDFSCNVARVYLLSRCKVQCEGIGQELATHQLASHQRCIEFIYRRQVWARARHR
jgi:hypothetical protein